MFVNNNRLCLITISRALLLAMAVSGVAVLSVAQTAQKPQFDVVSVKPVETPPAYRPNPMPTSRPIRISGNGVSFEGSAISLVLAAYNMRDFQVSGAPSWTGNSLYEINAKAEGDAVLTMGQARQMLQSLLADRFKLKVHLDSKQMSVYTLVVGKNGSKLKESESAKPSVRPLAVDSQLIRLDVVNRDIANIVGIISPLVDRPVMDRTGLTGNYHLTLEFTYGDPRVAPIGNAAAGPSIFTAVEEQLGLKLQPATEPVEILVIDSIERPTEN